MADLLNKFVVSKREYNGMMVGGRRSFSSTAQIFVECNVGNDGCHKSIALLPKTGVDRNNAVDSVTDNQAAEFFESYGWVIAGRNSTLHSACPSCQLNKEDKQ